MLVTLIDIVFSQPSTVRSIKDVALDTPKHGSWLNIAEIEQSALTIQCLSRRIASMEELQREATA
ncbi:hypothetical protein ABH894_003100 [Paenibacillus sp. RC62]